MHRNYIYDFEQIIRLMNNNKRKKDANFHWKLL